MGGAEAVSNWALASSVTYGQADSSACRAASFMAKARQVAKPHSLQFVCGNTLYIAMPLSAMWRAPFSRVGVGRREARLGCLGSCHQLRRWRA